MAWLLLLAFAVAWWVVSVRWHPFRRCPRCRGTGRNRGSGRYWSGECRRCRNRGRLPRHGAAMIHRGAVSLAEKDRRRRTR